MILQVATILHSQLQGIAAYVWRLFFPVKGIRFAVYGDDGDISQHSPKLKASAFLNDRCVEYV